MDEYKAYSSRRRLKLASALYRTIWLAIVVLILVVSLAAAVTDVEESEESLAAPHEYATLYDYSCFGERAHGNGSTLNLRQPSIGLQVSPRVSHQLMTRIFAIFLRDKLNYYNISLVPIEFRYNSSNIAFESQKLMTTLNYIRHHNVLPDMSMINLEVRMPSVAHNLIPPTIYEAGQSISTGRFGWFVPESHERRARTPFDSRNYTIFFDQSHPNYQQYVISAELLRKLKENTSYEEFISPQCLRHTCVTLLAEYLEDTSFIKHQIIETNSYLNVLWLGKQFRRKVTWLYQLYENKSGMHAKRFIVLHWTPSAIIDADIHFAQIEMPRCELYSSLVNTLCKYELTPVLKYYAKSLANFNDRLFKALYKFTITDAAWEQLQHAVSLHYQQSDVPLTEMDYNHIACDWLKANERVYKNWITKETRPKIFIGGIFPISDTTRGHQNLVTAVDRAVAAINNNNTLLADYEFVVLRNDGKCKADMVMKAFIHYFNVPNVLGVLGPACSETVEPIAGISKHMNMAVISYSAEGATFVDRDAYPFFFRTIGSNRQYEDVYIRLLQAFGWRRVAALTEDGQKYTEYISYLETTMKQWNQELILNKKFPSDVKASEMNKYLIDLKKRRAKIIIADVQAHNAALVLCEASKLEMTAYQGYVWFLPSWLSSELEVPNDMHKPDISCTREELLMAFEGHFSIMHAPFAEPNAIMQENITVSKWLESYGSARYAISNYTGFTYDAIWAYALAADKLLRENSEAIKDIRSPSVANRFVQYLWQTDFQGLSGRIRFGLGGSRITNLNIMQWRNGQFWEVGKFEPTLKGNGSSLHPSGGHLTIFDHSIEWFSGLRPPGDGTYDCNFSSLAELMGIHCDSAAVVMTGVMCLMAVVVISLVSFLFWKQRYDSKLKESAKIMKSLGIDLLSPSQSLSNTLDKWEVPKQNVFVNRRLGEGAFGTVYGGEAQLGSGGWTAVAVKTLKAGASMEDRLNFLSEAQVMKCLDNKNIIKLLGVCLESEPFYTIMEFMLYGDLKTYLLARRHLVNDKISDESDISSKRLTMYALDVARGLAYLAENKYVHRDLACRNCLVNAQRVVKIGDFGMARPTCENNYYRYNKKGMLPVRWMAPESLETGIYTIASDVWAFGVVLYEIITFGSFPYQGITNDQVRDYLKSGKTLSIPDGCKPQLEALLRACWSYEPEKRPTAAYMAEYITNNPRLLTPCLDFPGASVEMPETESDELELIPRGRRHSPGNRNLALDILPQMPPVSNYNNNTTNNNSNTETLNPADHSNNVIDIDRSNGDQIDESNANVIEMDERLLPHLPANNGGQFSPITPDGYSVMSPLMMRHENENENENENSDSSQLQLLPHAVAGEALYQTPF